MRNRNVRPVRLDPLKINEHIATATNKRNERTRDTALGLRGVVECTIASRFLNVQNRYEGAHDERPTLVELVVP